MENEKKQYMLVDERPTAGRVEKKIRTLVDDEVYNSYESAIAEAKRHLVLPTQIIYVMEVRGKCFAKMDISDEKMN